MRNAYEIVDAFERRVAEFAGAQYAVAVDSCTNGLFLSLKWLARDLTHPMPTIVVPARTYCSVPMAVRQAGFGVAFNDYAWIGAYTLSPTCVVDGAKRFRRGMYMGGYHCLSFHIKKSINIGRGGMILHDDHKFDSWARSVRHNGRSVVDPANRSPVRIGYDCYMTPDQAARGLMLMDVMPPDGFPDQTEAYPDLRGQRDLFL